MHNTISDNRFERVYSERQENRLNTAHMNRRVKIAKSMTNSLAVSPSQSVHSARQQLR